jgi:hypothetical protein
LISHLVDRRGGTKWLKKNFRDSQI